MPPQPAAASAAGCAARSTTLGLLPFAVFVALFLLWPTVLVVLGAFQDPEGGLTLANLAQATQGTYLETFVASIVLSAITAVLGAVFGGLLAWAISVGRRDGLLRRLVLAGSGTLAQFGGVMLAFAFLATFGFNGLVTLFLHDRLGVDTFAWGGWIYELPGLVLVYTYFQIPLMVIVFLPAVDGLRPQWREACDEPRRQRLDLLAPRRRSRSSWPSFLGATLLLFANAFSAYATAKALISQASPLVPLRIGTFLTSEIVLGQANVGKALALGMIVDRRGDHDAVRAAAAADRAMAAMSGAGAALAGRRRAALGDAPVGRRLHAAAARGDAGVLHARHRRRAQPRALARDRRQPGPARGDPGVARARRAHRRADARPAGADHGLGAAAAAAAAARGRVRLPAAADHPGDRARGRARAGLPLGLAICSANPRSR